MGSAAADAGGSSHQTGIAGGGQRVQRESLEAKPGGARNYGLHPPSSQPELEQGRPGRVCLPRRSLALFSGEDSAPGDVPQPVPKLQAPSASERPPGVPGESRVSPAPSVLPPGVSSIQRKTALRDVEHVLPRVPPGRPMRFVLTGGQAADAPQAIPVLTGIETAYVIAGKGYESNKIPAFTQPTGATAVIPSKSNRRDPWEYGRELYRECNLIERAFNKLKL